MTGFDRSMTNGINQNTKRKRVPQSTCKHNAGHLLALCALMETTMLFLRESL